MVGLLQVDTQSASYQTRVNTDRIALVTAAVERLAARAQTFDLGIFAAPEYLLTNQNANQPIGLGSGGGYFARGITEQTKEDNLTALKDLSEVHPKLLLIPGTMAWLKPFDRELGIERHKTEYKEARHPGKPVLNRPDKAFTANLKAKDHGMNRLGIEMVGGKPEFKYTFAQKKLMIVQSGTDKTINILRNSLYVIWNDEIWHKYNKIADYEEVKNATDQPSVFIPGDFARKTKELFGKNFGFEICLDHVAQLYKYNRDGSQADRLDMHILLSASAHYNKTKLTQGGLFIHASSDATLTGVKRMGATNRHNIAENLAIRDVLDADCTMRYFETETDMVLRA
jgi:hypothetical protein